jgi:uncharacterized protein (DUF1800 family)
MGRNKHKQTWFVVSSLGLCLVLSFATACGILGGGSSNAPVKISPAQVSLRTGATQLFTATVTKNSNQSVTWALNGVAGGNATFGTITAAGLYTAPKALPTPDTLMITATSAADATLAGSTTITVENPLPTVSAVTPATLPSSNFSITVTGSGFISDSVVEFGGQKLTTKYVSATQLTATGTATASQKGTTVNLTVVNPDPGGATSSPFAIKVGAAGVVAVSPTTQSLRLAATQQFVATPSGFASNGTPLSSSVTWSVNGVKGGNSGWGTVSTTGSYTAPAALPSPATVTVTATSVTDTTITGQGAISLENPMPVLSSLSSPWVPVGNFSLTLNGSGFVSNSQVMFGGTALATKFISPTQLSATGTTTSSQLNTKIAVTVANPNPGAATSSALDVSVGTDPVKVVISPAGGQLFPGQTMLFKATVTGISSQTVTWTVNNGAVGNSTLGTITSAGLYTAPATVTNPFLITIGAIASDGTHANGINVQLLSALPVVNSVLPLTLPVGNFTVSVKGSNFISGAQVAFNGTLLPTTYISSTELSANGTANAAGTFPVDVTNPGPGSPTSNAVQVTVGSSNTTVTAAAAARFLEQSTFGPTPQLIQHVQTVGFQAFLNEQFAALASTYTTPTSKQDIHTVQAQFFTNGLNGQDQLRQRVAFALSQIMVISNQKIGDPTAFSLWMNMMQKDSFGNYSTLLNDVTVSPAMGNYLDMANNDKPDPNTGQSPNENYAREVLQLFSIGLAQLNPDGTVQVDGSGNPVPTYTQDTIEGFAHVFTGWSYPPQPGKSPQFWSQEYYSGPMIPFDSHHDTGPKLLLNGTTLPGGGTTQGDLTAALQNIFQHPNVGPFISKQLIQHLVTSNPSPAYVSRVAAVFADNGSGVRGDLKAVVTAILLDPEARRGDDATQVQASDGHMKEPILFMLNLMRAMNATSDGVDLNWIASDMKQEPFESTTVFNFYPPNYVIQGTQLLGPEFKIFNESTTISRINFVNSLVYWQATNTTTVDLSPYVALAGSPQELVDTLNGIMMHGQMSDNMKATVLSTVTAISDNKARAKAALYLIGSSSQYQVEH